MTPSGHFPPDYVTIQGAVPAGLLEVSRAYIEALPPDQFDTYQHRFEPKLCVKKNHYAVPPLGRLLDFLRARTMREFFGHCFGMPGAWPDDGYFTAFYVYRPGDYLQNHIDAAVHGDDRKVITLNLYLSDCEGGELVIGQESVPSRANTLVAFLNHDSACHGVRMVTEGRRIMVTTGLVMSNSTFPRPRFNRMGRKAWFLPWPGEQWSEADLKARDERAGESWGKGAM